MRHKFACSEERGTILLKLIRSIPIYFIGQVHPASIQRECSFLFCLILKLQPVAKTCSVETL